MNEIGCCVPNSNAHQAVLGRHFLWIKHRPLDVPLDQSKAYKTDGHAPAIIMKK